MARKRWPIHLSFFLIAYYVANCMYQTFISLYYTSVSFTTAQIGVVNAAVALVSMIAQPLWGTVGDRTPSRRLLLALMSVGAAVAAWSFGWFSAFLPLLLLACVFSCFYTSLQPMGDSIILKELDRQGLPFGPFRLAGGMSFALAGVVFGRLLNGPGRERLIPAYTAAMCLVTGLSAFSLPRTPGGQQRGSRMRFTDLFKQRELMGLLAFMCPIQITMGFFYSFFSPHFMTLPAADSAKLGLCFTLSACSEVPFLLMSDRLFDRYGAEKLMRLSAITLAVRWIIMGLTGNVYVAMASQLLHGWGFIVMTVCMAKYISRSVPEELQASGQMLLAIVSFGISRAFGNLVGGLLAGSLGMKRVFLMCSAVCVITLAVELAMSRRRATE